MTRSEGDSPVVRLRLPASAAYIAPVRSFLGRMMEVWFPDRSSFDATEEFLVAVQEAVTNVIRHAYRGGRGDLDLEVRLDDEGDGIEALLRDWGGEFDPSTVPPPDFENPKPGGYGLHVMRSFTDRCEFSRDGRTNLLLLSRRLRVTEPAPGAGR